MSITFSVKFRGLFLKMRQSPAKFECFSTHHVALLFWLWRQYADGTLLYIPLLASGADVITEASRWLYCLFTSFVTALLPQESLQSVFWTWVNQISIEYSSTTNATATAWRLWFVIFFVGTSWTMARGHGTDSYSVSGSVSGGTTDYKI